MTTIKFNTRRYNSYTKHFIFNNTVDNIARTFVYFLSFASIIMLIFKYIQNTLRWNLDQRIHVSIPRSFPRYKRNYVCCYTFLITHNNRQIRVAANKIITDYTSVAIIVVLGLWNLHFFLQWPSSTWLAKNEIY